MKAEVIIVGGGVIGLAIARQLRLDGVKSIAVLERGLIGNEASNAAAGMLAVQAETDRADRFFEFCRHSNSAYVDYAAALSDETGVDIQLDRTGTLYLAFGAHDTDELARRFEWQRSAGLNVSRLDRRSVLEIEPAVGEGVCEGLLFPDDCQVENRKLVEALATFARVNGIDVVEGCEVTSLKFDGEKVAGVNTISNEHSCDLLVLATGAWTSGIEIPREPLSGFKPIKGEIVTFGISRGLVRHVIYSPRGYLVPRADGRILAGATVEDVGFDKSVTAAAEESIKSNAFEIVPKLSELEVRERLVGLRPWAEGGQPVIGRVPDFENLFVAAGHFRNGILLAPATAELVADVIAERGNGFAGDFSPGGRKS